MLMTFHCLIYWQYSAAILRVQKAKVDQEKLYMLNLIAFM